MAFELPIAHLDSTAIDVVSAANLIGVAITNNALFVTCNTVFTDMFGDNVGELVGTPVRSIFPNDAAYAEFLAIAHQRSPDLRTPFEINWRFPRAGKDDLLCRIRAQPLELHDGNSSTLWIFENVGPAIQRASAFQKSLDQLEALMQNAPVGIIVTVNRRLVKANPAFCRMFGYSQRQALTLTGRDLFVSDQAYADLGMAVAPLLSKGAPFQCEIEMVRSNAEILWAHLVAYVVNEKITDEGTIWMISDRSAEKRSEISRRKVMLENQVILDSALVGIIYLKDRIVQRCNPKAEQIFGYAPGEMVGVSTRSWYRTEAEYERMAEETYSAIVAGNTYTIERSLLRVDGTSFWCRMAGQVSNPEDPIGGPSIWVVDDQSQRHASEQELVNAKALMQAVFDSAKVSIIVTDQHGIIQMMNLTASNWLGYDPADLIGQVTPRVMHDLDEVVEYSQVLSEQLGTPITPGFDTFVEKARRTGSDEHEWTYIRRDGSRFPVHLTTSVLRDGAGEITGYIGVGIDMTDRNRVDNAMRVAQMHLEERVILRTAELASANLKLQDEITQRQAMEEKMRVMAHYDTLTGLPNRNLLAGRLEKAIALASRKGNLVGLMFIDLDRFKQVNDTLGHDAGDALLCMVAERMTSVIRDSDTLARHGGDEFVLLSPEVTHPAELAELADRLIGVFATPFEVLGHSVETTPSVGLAFYPDDCNDADSLLRCADDAMYQAKVAGKNRYFLFSRPVQESGER